LNKEFWSKNIKGELERVPFDRGVLSSTMKIGKIEKIDDWKNNSQYRENYSQHFNLKNLICSPITDSKGNYRLVFFIDGKNGGFISDFGSS